MEKRFSDEEARQRKNARQKQYQKDTQYAANRKYRKTHIRTMAFDFSLVNDQDILEKLDSVPNKVGYIKELIRKDITDNSEE